MTIALVVVGRVRKAFGLKGELLVHPITNEPDAVFASGRRVFVSGQRPSTTATDHSDHSDQKGQPAPAGNRDTPDRAIAIERSRPFKDGWLVKLEGVNDKTEADRWRGVDFCAPQSELTPPVGNELYLHELVGIGVRDEPHGEIGVVAGWYELPQGIVLEVRGTTWRADVPFNEAFVTGVDRAARTITVRLPDGLLEQVR